MSFAIQHVHVKTKDPRQTMQSYIDNLGATYVAEIPGRGHRLNLHGLTLNITTLISAQNHEQHYGIEHIALDTDDYSGALATMKGMECGSWRSCRPTMDGVSASSKPPTVPRSN